MSDFRSTDASGIRRRSSGSWARTLGAIIEQARFDERAVIRKCDLECGDRVIVKTRNSVYSLYVLGDDTYAVSGGWFERGGDTPRLVTVNGCTYGGSVIRHDVVAGRGLFLEFGNNVLTTRIQGVSIVKKSDSTGSSLPC